MTCFNASKLCDFVVSCLGKPILIAPPSLSLVPLLSVCLSINSSNLSVCFLSVSRCLSPSLLSYLCPVQILHFTAAAASVAALPPLPLPRPRTALLDACWRPLVDACAPLPKCAAASSESALPVHEDVAAPRSPAHSHSRRAAISGRRRECLCCRRASSRARAARSSPPPSPTRPPSPPPRSRPPPTSAPHRRCRRPCTCGAQRASRGAGRLLLARRRTRSARGTRPKRRRAASI